LLFNQGESYSNKHMAPSCQSSVPNCVLYCICATTTVYNNSPMSLGASESCQFKETKISPLTSHVITITHVFCWAHSSLSSSISSGSSVCFLFQLNFSRRMKTRFLTTNNRSIRIHIVSHVCETFFVNGMLVDYFHHLHINERILLAKSHVCVTKVLPLPFFE